MSVSGQAAVEAANMLATAVNVWPAAQIILTNPLDPDGKGDGAPGQPATKVSETQRANRAQR